MAFLEEKKRTEIIDRVALKKERLAMPVYELKDDELVNFPWNDENLNEWLYRPIKVKGRKIERLEMNFKEYYGQTPGATCMVPIVTKEDAERTMDSRSGLIINLGWMHHSVLNRHVRSTRAMDSDNIYEFVGFVTEGERYKCWFGKKANICCEQLVRFGDFYLPDMARATEFQNKEQVRTAILERVAMDTPLDEKDPRLMVGHDLCIEGEYPHAKTRAGALQCSTMPWDCRRRQQWWSLTAFSSAFVALVAKIH